MTLGVLPSITATQEFVVPRSIPMTLAMDVNPLFSGRSGRPNSARPRPPSVSLCPARFPGDFPLAHIGGRVRVARQDSAKVVRKDLNNRLPMWGFRRVRQYNERPLPCSGPRRLIADPRGYRPSPGNCPLE